MRELYEALFCPQHGLLANSSLLLALYFDGKQRFPWRWLPWQRE